MNPRFRRRLSMAFAVVAVLALGAKIFKGYHRGDVTQSRVKPVSER